MRSIPTRLAIVALALGAITACGDDGTGLALDRTDIDSGDGQTGPVDEALADPLRVIVTDEAGTPVSGITVTWSTNDAGSFDPATSTTGSDGIAETVWTLGGGSGGQVAQASVNGAANSPVSFSAAATGLSIPTINVSNNSFSPDAVTITAGGQVRFLWGGGAVGHNVNPATGNPSALPISAGAPATLLSAPQDFNVTFPATGTFRFHCTSHGSSPTPTTVSGMSGTVTVN
jgi:plastocyanin